MSIKAHCIKCGSGLVTVKSIAKHNGMLSPSAGESLTSGYHVSGVCDACGEDLVVSVPLSGWCRDSLMGLAYDCMGKSYAPFRYKTVRTLSHDERIDNCNVPAGTVIETLDRTPEISWESAERIIDSKVSAINVIPHGDMSIRLPPQFVMSK